MTTPFYEHVRTLLELKRLSIAELAERAELAPSLISKLLTDTDGARREPRLEHVFAIARALQVAPVDVVGGTDAESILAEWVPRTELEAESKARMDSQAQAAAVRTELAGAHNEIEGLKATVDQLSQALATVNRQRADSEARAQREHMLLRVAVESAEAKMRAAIGERDRALANANQNYRAWASACSQYQLLRRQVAESKVSAGLTALVATIGGALLAAAASEPSEPARSRPRRRT